MKEYEGIVAALPALLIPIAFLFEGTNSVITYVLLILSMLLGIVVIIYAIRKRK